MGINYFVPTGYVIKDYLDEYDISQKDLSKRIGVSEKHISNVLSGKARLTEEMALKLEYVLKDIPASYWLNYEVKYREYLVRSNSEKHLSSANLKQIAKRFHFDEVFSGLDWDIVKQAEEMLKILSISDFDCFENAYGKMQVDFMEDGGQSEAIAIWLKMCEEQIEIQNSDISQREYKKKNLENSIDMLKRAALDSSMSGIEVTARKICNRAGIYLVIYPAIKNCKVRGALYSYRNHPAIFLSGRFKTHDNIWFAFFHEIGHLLKHYNMGDIDVSMESEHENGKEAEANEYARSILIQDDAYKNFLLQVSERPKEAKKMIISFANQQGVLPGVVVGRMQHDKVIDHKEWNELKNKIVI